MPLIKVNVASVSQFLTINDVLKRVSVEELHTLSEAAWEARENAYDPKPTKGTKVGTALFALKQDFIPIRKLYTGCNIKHSFNITDPHAEMVAIFSAIADGARNVEILLVATPRDNFIPCGRCLDWIHELGLKAEGEVEEMQVLGAEQTVTRKTIKVCDTMIATQRDPLGPILVRHFRDLFPLYPY